MVRNRVRVVSLGVMLVLAAWSVAEAQPRAIYQQTQYKGRRSGA